MLLLAAKIIWCVGVVGWFVIRYPYARRNRRAGKGRLIGQNLERVLLAISTCGLGIIPALYVLGGVFRFADYPLQPWQPWVGAGIFGFALWLFKRCHSDLGRSWSVTLEVKDNQNLVSDGVYRYVRHPMYTAFLSWALAQAVLLPNWVAGFSGFVGFGILYLVRVGREEAMMIETFGEQYRAYMRRSSRLIPFSLFKKSSSGSLQGPDKPN